MKKFVYHGQFYFCIYVEHADMFVRVKYIWQYDILEMKISCEGLKHFIKYELLGIPCLKSFFCNDLVNRNKYYKQLKQ